MGWLTPYFRPGRRGNHEDHVRGEIALHKHGVWEAAAQRAEYYTRMHIWLFKRDIVLNMLANRDLLWQDAEQIESNLKQHGFM